MTQRSSSSNRLWAGVLVVAVAVIAMFVLDPLAADEADPLLDGSNDAPFVAVLQRDELPDAEPDEVLEKLEEADDEAGMSGDHAESVPNEPFTRGTRATAD